MKKLIFAARVLLIAFGAMSVAACGSGDKDTANDSTKNVSGTQKGEAFESNINVRYVDQDSLMKHYDYAIEQSEVLNKIQLELQQFEAQLGRHLQNKQAAIQQKVQSNGYLSEASYNADMQELQKLDQQSQAQYGARYQADMQRVAEINEAVIKSIDDYIVEYNKEKKYDAILYKQAGIYFNPALDITGELVKGLNAKYKATKGDKADDKAHDRVADKK